MYHINTWNDTWKNQKKKIKLGNEDSLGFLVDCSFLLSLLF